MFCNQPFNRIEIYENGDVYNCCPPFINNYSIGNIFQTPFDEIWNGEKSKLLRRKILNGDFSQCADICNKKNGNDYIDNWFGETITKYPEEISVSSDNTCNVKCKICRDENFHTTFNKDTLENEIETIWLPIFKDAKLLRFGCSGEPFASYKEMLLIKKSSQKYPDLKFHFHTNGILADEALLRDLNVFDKIDTMTVSLHSATFWTYNKIVRNGNWHKVMSNLKLYSSMKIKKFRMIFCVYSDNYKEMPSFIKLAKKYNAQAEFWALRPNNACEVGKNFDKYSIINPKHKYHKNLIKILHNPIFNGENVILYPELKNLIQ